MRFRRSVVPFAVVTFVFGVGCGGLVLDETDSRDAGSTKSDAVAPTPIDGGTATVEAPDAGCDGVVAALLASPAGTVGGFDVFYRLEDFLAFFEDFARATALVVPAHDIDCEGALDAGGCAYDPRTPRIDPADVHYSNALRQFTGPDGTAFIWAYVPDRNEWVTATDAESRAWYALVLAFNECTLQ